MLYGKITGVIQGKHPKYNVKLDSGETIIVEHNVIEPKPARLLKTGSRLVVLLDGRNAVWSSTDLSSRNKDIRQKSSNVRTILKEQKAQTKFPQHERKPEEPTPTLDNNNLRNQSKGHQKSSEVEREPEQQTVTIVDYNSREGQIIVQTISKKKIRVRLSKESIEWSKVFIGRTFTLETSYHKGDDLPGYTLLIPVDELKKEPLNYRRSEEHQQELAWEIPQEKEKQGPSSPSEKEPPFAHKEQSKQGEKAPPQAGRIEVDRIGIDPAYFHEREQEGHRFEIMAFIKEHLKDDLIEWYQMRCEQPARYGQPVPPLSSPINLALHSVDKSFNRFYTHQARSLEAIRAGRNLIIITPTASGKTLCYNPAIFEHFLSSDASAHALYLFPLNALLMDQKEKLDQIITALAKQGTQIRGEVLKGGIPRENRHHYASAPPHILALNPELLSVILGEAGLWKVFFASLRFVVIDEVHTYRGILGMHTSGLIRQLLLTTRRYGIEPQFILSSATVSNPMDLATRLTSLPAHSFDLLGEHDDGSFQANKHWAVLNPDAHNDSDGYDNYLNTAAMAMVELLTSRNAYGQPSPLNTILFAKSIREVKKVYKIVQDNLRVNHPELVSKVRHYVSSDMSTDEKREIYNGLKSGQLIGVISTNALEAGIDIGKLDACIITGFPFWVMRMRQMAGRVGRHQEGLVLFVPHPVKPLDQYYRTNPELLLDQPPEAFVVDAENSYITRKHINAAAYSLNGIHEEELRIFGSKASETVLQAIRDGVMQHNGNRYYGTRRYFKDTSDPYVIAGIRSNTQRPYSLCRAEASECQASAGCLDPNKKGGCERQIAVLDQPYAYRDCHPGAIYEAMDGEMYRVVSFDDAHCIIWLTPLPETTLERTFVEESTDIEILGAPRESKPLTGGAKLHLGDVRVTRSFTGFYTYSLRPFRRCRRCKRDYQETVLLCPICHKKTAKYFEQTRIVRHDFPAPYQGLGFKITLKTIACWMTVPAEMEKALEPASPCKLPGEDNRVQKFLLSPLDMDRLVHKYYLKPDEKQIIETYAQKAGYALQAAQKTRSNREIILFPGVYDQCLLHLLRGMSSESKALEIFTQLTQYPVVDNLRHVCRKCQTSSLFPAMHTIEHIVYMRYPSVALGDPTDLASHTTLGHPSTGQPTIFWYDNYEGGLGAADKVFDQIEVLLQNSERTIIGCSCTTLEGCPNCTQIGHCDQNNQALTKPGALVLIAALLGKHFDLPLTPFIYSTSKKAKFKKTSDENEYAQYDQGIDEEAPSAPPHGGPFGAEQEANFDPYLILRIQRLIHEPVLAKAYEVRSAEITDEIPAVSAVDLTRAYQEIYRSKRPNTWEINASQSPYQILEVLPAASQRMVQKIYRVIALEIHPDQNPTNKARANEMMKLVNTAYNQIIAEKKKTADEEMHS